MTEVQKSHQANQEVQKIDPAFKPLYTDTEKRYFLVTGGRGSLKSTTVSDFIYKLTFTAGIGILYTRYTLTSAKKSIIPEFELTLEKHNASQFFTVTADKIINNLSGGYIIFSGIKTPAGNQTARLKSIPNISTWVIDEMEDFDDEKTFDTIDDSVRVNNIQNRVIMVMNPTTRQHFVYGRFIAPLSKILNVKGWKVTVSNLPDVCHIHTTYHIAKEYLSRSFMRKAKKHLKIALAMANIYGSWYYSNYIGGWLEKAEGVILENWTEGAFDTTLSYSYGLDYGYTNDPTALVKVAVDERNKKIYCQELLYEDGMTTPQIAKAARRLIQYANDVIVGDSAEARLNDELRIDGLNVIGAKKWAGSVRQGILKLQEYELIVTPDSRNLKIELNMYAWSDKRAGVPVDAWNHLIDAIRYGLQPLLRGSLHMA